MPSIDRGVWNLSSRPRPTQPRLPPLRSRCFLCLALLRLSRHRRPSVLPSPNKTRHQVPLEDRFSVFHICDLRDLAVDLVKKCAVDPDADKYNGEDGQPWNVEPVFSVRLICLSYSAAAAVAAGTAAAVPSCVAPTHSFLGSSDSRICGCHKNPPQPLRFPLSRNLRALCA